MPIVWYSSNSKQLTIACYEKLQGRIGQSNWMIWSIKLVVKYFASKKEFFFYLLINLTKKPFKIEKYIILNTFDIQKLSKNRKCIAWKLFNKLQKKNEIFYFLNKWSFFFVFHSLLNVRLSSLFIRNLFIL